MKLYILTCIFILTGVINSRLHLQKRLNFRLWGQKQQKELGITIMRQRILELIEKMDPGIDIVD